MIDWQSKLLTHKKLLGIRTVTGIWNGYYHKHNNKQGKNNDGSITDNMQSRQQLRLSQQLLQQPVVCFVLQRLHCPEYCYVIVYLMYYAFYFQLMAYTTDVISSDSFLVQQLENCSQLKINNSEINSRLPFCTWSFSLAFATITCNCSLMDMTQRYII